MAAQGIIPVLGDGLSERRARLRRELGIARLTRLGHRAEPVPCFDPQAPAPQGWRFWSDDFGQRPDLFLSHMNAPDRLAGFTRAERERRLSLWKQHCPEAVDACIRQAAAFAENDFRSLVPGIRPMPDGVRWHAMIGCDGEWPRRPAGDYRHLDTDTQLRADVRQTWEINRLQHLPVLAGAYLATGDRAPLGTLVTHLESWMEQNPAGLGVNWLQAQETGLRASALIYTYLLVGDADALSDSLRLRWLALIGQLARVTALTHGGGPVTHNHLVSEAAALMAVGLLLPELDGARHWRKLGLRLLRREALKQVYPSGIHAELATGYHFFVMESLAWALAAQGLAGEPLDPLLTETLHRMAQAGERLLRSDGHGWRVGDNDDGRALRVAGELSTRRDGWLWLAFSLCGEQRGEPDSERIWLARRPVSGPPADEPRSRQPLASFSDAGLASLHAARTRLLFVAGATREAAGVPPNHRHADCLSLLLEHRGQVLLDDPGLLRYGPELSTRISFRHSAAHNAPCVDGADCMEVTRERFGVGCPPQVRDFRARWDGSRARLAAMHDGYPGMWLRRDLWVQPERWLLGVDRLSAVRSQQVLSSSFLTPLRWEFRDGLACIVTDSCVLARLVCLSSDAAFGPVETAPIAPRYGVETSAERLRLVAAPGTPLLAWALVLDESVDVRALACRGDTAGVTLLAEAQSLFLDALRVEETCP